MSKYSGILYSIRKKLRDRLAIMQTDSSFTRGYKAAVDEIENIIFDEEERDRIRREKDRQNLWYPGEKTPEDLKEMNTGDYILLVKALVDDEDVVKGGVYAICDYWTGSSWYDTSDNYAVDILYWTKLKWLRFPLPSEFKGMKREELFLK